MFASAVGGFPVGERQSGLYGFNGALVGLALCYYYGGSWQILLILLPAGMFSSLLMYYMLRRGLCPLTFPFVATTWLAMLLLNVAGWMEPVSSAAHPDVNMKVVEGILLGYGQVLFQESTVTGLIFIAAILTRSRLEAAYATIGSVFGLLCGYLAGGSESAVNLGLYGYNGVLCGIFFAGRTCRDLGNAMGATALSVVAIRLIGELEIPALTFPFVLASWVVLWLRETKAGYA